MLATLDLRRLSEMHGAERAYVSLYAAGEVGLRAVRSREQKIRAMLLGDEPETEHFEASMRLARQWLGEQADGSPGRCVFASWAGDFVEGHDLPVAVAPLLRFDSSPYIRPLAELLDEYEDFVVVAADNRTTRIFQVSAARVQDELRVRGDVKNRVRKGGWSQQRYARRREKQLHEYAKEVGDVLARLMREEGLARIVMLGTSETMAEIESVLPQDVRERVVGTRGADLRAGDDALLELAFTEYFAEERAAEQRLWDQVRDEYMRGGLAVVGAADVLAALAEGRVDALLVTRDAKLEGRRCRACDGVHAEAIEQCAACGANDTFPVDLVEELVEHAQRTSATVEFTDPIEGLREIGDVAAALRY